MPENGNLPLLSKIETDLKEGHSVEKTGQRCFTYHATRDDHSRMDISLHGFQLEEKDKKADAIKLWRDLAHLDDAERYQELHGLFSVKKRTVEAWTKDVRAEEKKEKQKRAWDLWLDCWSQEQIAEKFGDCPRNDIKLD